MRRWTGLLLNRALLRVTPEVKYFSLAPSVPFGEVKGAGRNDRAA